MAYKPRIFIGSSSEGLKWANKAKTLLETDFQVSVWDSGVFKPNQNFLDVLLKATLKYDYGLLIGTTDDKVTYKGKEVVAPRDNVLFELGLFFGRLGTSKCGFIIDKDIKIPSDLEGIVQTRFAKNNINSFIKAVEIIRVFFKENSHPEINFLPSSTLASVYYENFLAPLCKHITEKGGFKVDDKAYSDCPIQVIIPERINTDVNLQFEKLKVKFKTRPLSFIYAGRPRNVHIEVHEEDNQVQIIDFPTVISGINHAIAHLIPQEFNFQNADYEGILQREVENFCATLTLLLKRSGFNDMVCLKHEATL